jgi:hypothetical protein
MKNLFKDKSAPECKGTHRLIWSNDSGRDRWSELLDRAEALRQFDNLSVIRNACHPHSNRRLRVVAEVERIAALRRLAEAALVAL